MVDLTRTEEQMLAEIDWKTCVSVTGRTPDDLLPILRTAISRR